LLKVSGTALSRKKSSVTRKADAVMSSSHMDVLNHLIGDLSKNLSGGLLESVLGILVAMAVLRFEVTRRSNGNSQGSVAACCTFLRQWAPETFGVVACLVLSVVLRKWGEEVALQDPGMQEIFKEWPILLGADTLLSIQAMLRLLVFLSLALRARSSLPFSQEAAALFLVAGISRTALVLRSNDYKLDGPLGGDLPIYCEMAALPLLGRLTLGIHRGALCATAMTAAIALWLALRNHLNLASDTVNDSLFAFAHLMELVSAFAFLFRTLLADNGLGSGKGRVPLGFAYILLPIQQCLSAYYFVQAFQVTEGLVGKGHPFELLQLGGVAQCGAYGAAAVLYFAEYLEG